jgi:phosphoribosylformimino-5-aminoimidazole carboxamide ribotide isomerase
LAIQKPITTARLVDQYGTVRIAAAINVRKGRALGEAWRAGTEGTQVDEAVRRLVGSGVTVFETTAIHRDGVLSGPDLALLASVVALGVEVIASGGIRSKI